jgi:hypothetical protein
VRARELRRQQEMREVELAERGSETEDYRVEPVREANEEIENEREAVLDGVANEGARFQVLPVLDKEVSVEGTGNFRVPPERRYVEDDRV